MRLFFISDLHLKSEQDLVAKYFCNFLKNVPQKNDVLILGGDIFDLFIGDKEVFKKQFPQILAALGEVTAKGCNLHYLEGNHDFHLTGVFPEAMKIHMGDFPFAFAGKKIWISHGDRIDKKDYGYRFLRFFTRSFLGMFLIRVLPDAAFSMIGKWSSETSRQYNNLEKLSAVKQKKTVALFRAYADEKHGEGYEYVFIGHSHLPDFTGHYVNLGFSRERLLYAIMDSAANTISLADWQSL